MASLTGKMPRRYSILVETLRLSRRLVGKRTVLSEALRETTVSRDAAVKRVPFSPFLRQRDDHTMQQRVWAFHGTTSLPTLKKDTMERSRSGWRPELYNLDVEEKDSVSAHDHNQTRDQPSPYDFIRAYNLSCGGCDSLRSR